MGVILHAVLFLNGLFYTVEQTWQKELIVLYMSSTVPVGTKNSLLSLLLSSLRRDGAVLTLQNYFANFLQIYKITQIPFVSLKNKKKEVNVWK